MQRPLLILTLEGLATSALSCYGSSWNSTPAIDAIAASGCVWDRWIATTDDPAKLIGQWVQDVRWPSPRESRAVFLSDDVTLSADAIAQRFDEDVRIELDTPLDQDVSGGEIESTQFGQLVAAAMQVDQREPWQILWLHSRCLSTCWDAPRDLFPSEEVEPEVDQEWEDEQTEIEADGQQPPPPIFNSVALPQLQLAADSHPDLITSWMRTYGCQVRLVDLLIEVLLQSLSSEDPQVIVAGTSGLSLGQNGWIGHRAGPLRSCDLRLPMIASDRGPIRAASLTPSDRFSDIVSRSFDSGLPWVTPQEWNQAAGTNEAVTTTSRRASRVITTAEWQFVRDLDDSDHLYFKPDDVDDFNDVGRLKPEVIQQLLMDTP